MPIWAAVPSSTDAHKNDVSSTFLIKSRKRLRLSICWATCSTSGSNIRRWCPRVTPVFLAKSVN